MATEPTGRRELAELVADHRFGHEHGHVLAAVMNREGVADELGEDGRTARPGLDDRLSAGLVELQNLVQQPGLAIGALLGRAAHPRLPPRRRTIILLVDLLRRGWGAPSGFAPGGFWVFPAPGT